MMQLLLNKGNKRFANACACAFSCCAPLKLESPLWMGVLWRLFGSLGVVIDGNSVSRRLVYPAVGAVEALCDILGFVG